MQFASAVLIQLQRQLIAQTELTARKNTTLASGTQ